MEYFGLNGRTLTYYTHYSSQISPLDSLSLHWAGCSLRTLTMMVLSMVLIKYSIKYLLSEFLKDCSVPDLASLSFVIWLYIWPQAGAWVRSFSY